MRAPSLIAQCLRGLVTQDRAGHVATVNEKDAPLPSPAVEIASTRQFILSSTQAENVDFQGIRVLKGRISVADIIGFAGSEKIFIQTCWNRLYTRLHAKAKTEPKLKVGDLE